MLFSLELTNWHICLLLDIHNKRMKKKGSELYQSDINDCRRFAKMHSAHVFDIYEKKDDPFFSPSKMADN